MYSAVAVYNITWRGLTALLILDTEAMRRPEGKDGRE